MFNLSRQEQIIIFGLIGAIVVGCAWMLIEKHASSDVSAVYVRPTAERDWKSTKININKAGPHELQRLPHIGPKLSQRIIDYRNEHGPFEDIHKIQDVPGIGPKTYAALKDKISVE